MTGYSHPLYAAALAEFGRPVELTSSGGWILERRVPDCSRLDAMGCYPLFTCRDWSKLRGDLDSLAGRLLTVAIVLDPFAPLTPGELAESFDLVKPFKEHCVVDVSEPPEKHITQHHRYYARKALQHLRVELATDPPAHLDEWVGLYQILIQRHGLGGIKAFSRDSFATQLRVPGLVMFRTLRGAKTVGAHLWFVQSGVAYSHLAAFSDEGYRTGAAYALYWEAIRTFREQMSDQVRWIDLGAGAGIAGNDGLTQFKSGWARARRMKHFCGRVFDREAYAGIAQEKGVDESDYFPAYRRGEF